MRSLWPNMWARFGQSPWTTTKSRARRRPHSIVSTAKIWWPRAELNHRHTDFQNWPQQAFYSKSSSCDTRQVPRAAASSLRVLAKSRRRLRTGYAGREPPRKVPRSRGRTAEAWGLEIRGNGETRCSFRPEAIAACRRATCYGLVYSFGRNCARSAASDFGAVVGIKNRGVERC